MVVFCGLHFNFHAGVHLCDFIAEYVVQNFVGALAGAVACVDFLNVQISEAFGECFHAVVGRAEQMESAEDGIDLFAGECRFDFLDDVVGTAMATAVHDEQALGRIEDETLFVVKTVGTVLAVFLDAHVGAFADFIEIRSLVANERDSWKNFTVAVGKYDAVCIALERPLADADVFLVSEEFENFVRVVAVFVGGIAQVKFGVAVLVEEFLHAVRVVVMRVAQDARINLRNIDVHIGRVLGELCGGSRVEQNALAVKFRVDTKSPFTL